MNFEVRHVRTVLYAYPVQHGMDLLQVNPATKEVTVRCEAAPSPTVSTSPRGGTAAAAPVSSTATETFAFEAIQYAPFTTMLYTSALADTAHRQFTTPLMAASTGASPKMGTQCLTLVQGGPPTHTTETFRQLAQQLLEDALSDVGDYAKHRFRVEWAAVAHTPAGAVDLLQSSRDLSEVPDIWAAAERRVLPSENSASAVQALLQRVAPADHTLKGMRQLRVTLVDTRTGCDVTSHTLCLCPSMDLLCAQFLEDVDQLRENLLVVRSGAYHGSLLQQSILSGICPTSVGSDGCSTKGIVVDRLTVVSCVVDSSSRSRLRPSTSQTEGMSGRALWETCRFGASSGSQDGPRSLRQSCGDPTLAIRTHPHLSTADQLHNNEAVSEVVAANPGRVEGDWQTRVEALEKRANAASQVARPHLNEVPRQEREAAQQVLADYEQKLDALQARVRESHRRALAAEREADKAEERLEGFRSQADSASRRAAAQQRDADVAAVCLVLEEEHSRRLTLIHMETSQRQTFYLQRERDLAEASYDAYLCALEQSKATADVQLEQLQQKRDEMATQALIASDAVELLAQHSLLWADALTRRHDALLGAADTVLLSHDWRARQAEVRAEIEEASQLLDAMRVEMQASLDAKARASSTATAAEKELEETLRSLQREKETAAQHLDALHQSITEASEKYARLLRDLEATRGEVEVTEDTRRGLVQATQAAQKQYADTRWLLGEKERELEEMQNRAKAAAQALGAARAYQKEADAQEKHRQEFEDVMEAALARQRLAEDAARAIASPEYQSAQSPRIEALRRGEEAKRREAAVSEFLTALTRAVVEEETWARRQLEHVEGATRYAVWWALESAEATRCAAMAACELEEGRGRTGLQEAEQADFTALLFRFCVPHRQRETMEAVAAAREEKEALEQATEALLEDIEGLQVAREAIEAAITDIVQSLNDATDEMEEQESELESRAARTERNIRVSETESALHFDSRLSRCTELISQSRRRQSSIASLGTRSLSTHPAAQSCTFPNN